MKIIKDENFKKKLTAKRKTRIFKIVFALLAISAIFSIYNFINSPASIPNKEYEMVKSDYVLRILQCIVGMIVIFLPSQFERKFGLDIPDTMEIMYFIFLFCAIYLGEVKDFYYKIPHWDTILHAFSATMLGSLGFILVQFFNSNQIKGTQLSPFFVSLFAFCFAVTCGAIWEIYEYLADYILGTNMQKFMTANGTILTGHNALMDTMKDIIVDVIGALFIVSLGYIHLKGLSKKNNDKKECDYN
ncbi:hypothetical protein [Miniphocaeibacter massiliensis]|uniref:hypothetical protein n=1 Tax=Miniphocaeibacter massiliensis TaxID=2041841 RepID=UPI000C1BB0CA|nr:hypothetical protein [Miniphocaeibacter massiliensis]